MISLYIEKATVHLFQPRYSDHDWQEIAECIGQFLPCNASYWIVPGTIEHA